MLYNIFSEALFLKPGGRAGRTTWRKRRGGGCAAIINERGRLHCRVVPLDATVCTDVAAVGSSIGAGARLLDSSVGVL